MTVQELASKMNELVRDGLSNTNVYFTSDGEISHPVLGIWKDEIKSLNVPVIILIPIKEPNQWWRNQFKDSNSYSSKED